jgi:acyl-coenzyme A synthetase/AMP-(fatty) acid ligase/aryl carrier-like protein
LGEALRTRGDYGLVKLTPSHLRLLTAQLKREEVAGASWALVVGGEQLTAEVTDWWRQHAPGVRIFNEYGPTETVVGCCVFELTQDDERAGAIPIGRPIANTKLYILDAECQPVPVGVIGELFIGGEGVARGYLNRVALTAERFIADPFGEGRLYKTGDLARFLPGGEIEYVGRRDEQVKLRGYRIELGEIEAALTRHAGVREATVVVRGERLAAYVVASRERTGEVEAAELREHLRGMLPEYMVPQSFVWMAEMPLTSNGKVNRKALQALVDDAPERTASYVAPRTPTEELLSGLWAEVLHVERVGAEDNFFELGGHSLLATQLVSRMRDVFGVEVDLRKLFEQPTVAALALTLEESILAEIETLTEADAQQLL